MNSREQANPDVEFQVRDVSGGWYATGRRWRLAEKKPTPEHLERALYMLNLLALNFDEDAFIDSWTSVDKEALALQR